MCWRRWRKPSLPCEGVDFIGRCSLRSALNKTKLDHGWLCKLQNMVATGGPELPPPTFCLQPLLMHVSNLQVLSLFAQLTDLGHVRFQLSFVTTNDTDSYYRPLPFVLIGHLGNRGVETGT